MSTISAGHVLIVRTFCAGHVFIVTKEEVPFSTSSAGHVVIVSTFSRASDASATAPTQEESSRLL